MEDLGSVFKRLNAVERDVEGLKRADAQIIKDIAKISAELAQTATKKDIAKASQQLATKIDTAVRTIVETVITVFRAKH